MSKKILQFGLVVIALLGFGKFAFGAFNDYFLSIQLAGDPTNGECLTTNGTDNVWGDCGSDASAITYSRDAYSSRFSEAVNVSTVEGALDTIFDFSYVAPAITLSANPSASTREFGNPITSIDFTATTVKKSNPITTVSYWRGASAIHYEASPNPSGAAETYTETTNVESTTSFTAKVSDGTATTTSNTITYTFVYPFYYGVGSQGLTPAQIQGLTKSVKTKSNTTTITSPSNEVYYLAYPASYGVLTSILDTNGFETIDDYTIRVENFTMLDSTSQSYRIYEFNNLTSQTNFTNQYKY